MAPKKIKVSYNGEVLCFFVEDNKTVSFETMSSVMPGLSGIFYKELDSSLSFVRLENGFFYPNMNDPEATTRFYYPMFVGPKGMEQCASPSESDRPNTPQRKENASSRFYVSGISPDTTKEDLISHFSSYGSLNDVWMPYVFVGFCFVAFNDCISDEILDQDHIIKQNKLKIEPARKEKK